MTGAGANLATPLSELKGVGDVVGRGLGRLGLVTVKDLLEFFPRRWDDYSEVHAINQIRPGLVTVRGRVEHVAHRRSFRNRKLSVTEAIIADSTGTIRAVWFNQPFIKAQLKEGETYALRGKFEFKSNFLSLQNPVIEPIKSDQPPGKHGHIIPTYKENNAITSKLVAKLVAQVLECTDELEDGMPRLVLEQEGLMSYGHSIRELHQPTSAAMLQAARDRLAFEELFILLKASD